MNNLYPSEPELRMIWCSTLQSRLDRLKASSSNITTVQSTVIYLPTETKRQMPWHGWLMPMRRALVYANRTLYRHGGSTRAMAEDAKVPTEGSRVKRIKPTSPGMRHRVVVHRDNLHRGKPYKPLTQRIPRSAGRDKYAYLISCHLVREGTEGGQTIEEKHWKRHSLFSSLLGVNFLSSWNV